MAAQLESEKRGRLVMNTFQKISIVLVLSITGAYVGYTLHLPIGLLVGSFVFIATAKIIGLDVPPLEKKYKQKIQMVIGGLVGLNLQPDVARLFLKVLIPGLFATFFHLLFAFFIAYSMSKLFGVKWLTALTGSIPAGMSEISNIAEEIDVDEQVVMLMHIFRVSLLILILPVLIKFIFL